MSDEGYATFDHTGDLGLEVWAQTPERLYALAVEAVLAQVVEAHTDTIDVRSVFKLEGDDPGDLLVHWLNTALLQAELDQAVWTKVTVARLSDCRLQGCLEGPLLDADRDVLLREIKAVSYHHLEVDLEPPDCRCRLILDI